MAVTTEQAFKRGLQSIGQLGREVGVKTPTIRFYESIGLLPPAPRTQSDRRLYDDDASRRLAFIKRARDLGFGMDSVRSLLSLSDDPERSCLEASLIARAHLADVECRIEHLVSLRHELLRLSQECSGEKVSNCRVIEALNAAPPAPGQGAAR